jgi:hypothetical protein
MRRIEGILYGGTELKYSRMPTGRRHRPENPYNMSDLNASFYFIIKFDRKGSI